MDATAIRAMMAEIAPVIREYVETEMGSARAENDNLRKANDALAERIVALEQREVPGFDTEQIKELVDGRVSETVSAAFATLPVPQDGKSVDMEEVRGLVAEAVAEIPVPQNGADCDMAAVETMLDEKVAAAVSALPLAEPGKDAEVDMEAVAELIDKAVAQRPLPNDGKDCDMEAVAEKLAELVNAAVAGIAVPKDGVGLSDALKNQDGELVLVLADGTTRNLGKIDGEPGRDGLGFEDLNVEQVGERTVRFLLRRGQDEAEFDINFPVPIYRDVWQEKGEYERGDMATWGGCLWHCDEPKGLKPGAADSGWTLVAKKGRDGKDAGK